MLKKLAAKLIVIFAIILVMVVAVYCRRCRINASAMMLALGFEVGEWATTSPRWAGRGT